MCRAEVTPQAAPMVADLLDRLRHALAEQYECDPDSIVVGPVDLGPGPS